MEVVDQEIYYIYSLHLSVQTNYGHIKSTLIQTALTAMLQLNNVRSNKIKCKIFKLEAYKQALQRMNAILYKQNGKAKLTL